MIGSYFEDRKEKKKENLAKNGQIWQKYCGGAKTEKNVLTPTKK